MPYVESPASFVNRLSQGRLEKAKKEKDLNAKIRRIAREEIENNKEK